MVQIQYVILETTISNIISTIVEKYAKDPITKRYVRQMVENIVSDVLREARKRNIGLSDLFDSEGWVLREISERISNTMESIGIPSEDVQKTVLGTLSSELKSPSTYFKSIAKTMSEVLSGKNEDVPDEYFSEKVLNRLIESADEFVYLASPWVSSPEDLVNEGVISLKGLKNSNIELCLLVASEENDEKVLKEWAALGFEIREAEGRHKNELGIHCKVYANEKMALGASWNLTVSGLRRLRAMREVHTLNPKTEECDVCKTNYEQLISEFNFRWMESKQKFFSDEGIDGRAVFKVEWDDDRPRKILIYRENGKRWLTINLREDHDGFVLNGRVYRYVEEYHGFTTLFFQDPDIAAKVVYPFVGLKLKRIRPEHLDVVEKKVDWKDNAKKYVLRFTDSLYDGAFVVWGLDPDPNSYFYVYGGRLLVAKCEEDGGTITVKFIDSADPDDMPDWVFGMVDVGLLFDSSSGEGTPTLFVYD
ncbi:hypothetical protein [Methanopyrus sp.]